MTLEELKEKAQVKQIIKFRDKIYHTPFDDPEAAIAWVLEKFSEELPLKGEVFTVDNEDYIKIVGLETRRGLELCQ